MTRRFARGSRRTNSTEANSSSMPGQQTASPCCREISRAGCACLASWPSQVQPSGAQYLPVPTTDGQPTTPAAIPADSRVMLQSTTPTVSNGLHLVMMDHGRMKAPSSEHWKRVRMAYQRRIGPFLDITKSVGFSSELRF